jgi:hypothetical protein
MVDCVVDVMLDVVVAGCMTGENAELDDVDIDIELIDPELDVLLDLTLFEARSAAGRNALSLVAASESDLSVSVAAATESLAASVRRIAAV